MAQADYVVANGTGAAVRSDLNGQLAAIVSNNSGVTEPATMYAYQWWADTTTGLLKIRNAANNAWITVGTLADANLGLLSLAGGTLTGALLADDSGTAALPAIAFDGDPNTGIFSPGADQLGIATNGVERVEFGTSEVVFNDGGADVDFRVEGDTKANLFKVDAGTDAVSIDGAFSVAGDASVNSLNGGPLAGTRNRIINGDMRIDQRNAGALINPAVSAYTLDRWNYFQSQTSKGSIGQDAGAVTPPAGFTNYLGFTSASSYSITTTDQFFIEQKLEGFNVADFDFGKAAAKLVTLSFWVRSSLTGTFGGVIRNSAGDRNYPFAYTISAANTWEAKSVTIPGDTSGTWLSNNGVGLGVVFNLGTGSTYSATAGAWTGTSFITAPTGATSVVGTSGATFYITGVQLEPGTVATPFERRSYGQELALCQRYYQSVRVTAVGYVLAAQSIGSSVSFVEKRAAPTATLGTIHQNNNASNQTFDSITTNSARVFANSVSTGQVGWNADYALSIEL